MKKFKFILIMLLACAPALHGQNKARMADMLLVDAVRLYDSGEYQQAYDMLRQIETIDDGNDAVKYYLGNIMAMAGKKEEALSHYSKAYAIDSTNVWYAMRLAGVYNDLRRPREALKVLESIPASKASSTEVLAARVDSFLMTGELEKADSLLTRMETMTGGSDYTSLTRLELLRQKADYPAFFSYLKTYFREGSLTPAGKTDILRRVMRSFDPRFNYVHLKDYEDINDICLQMHPADTAVAHFATSLYFSTKRYDDVIRLAESFQDDPEMVEGAMVACVQTGSYKGAIRHADRLQQISAGNPRYMGYAAVVKADCYYNMGQKEKAFKEYEAALKINPQDATVLNNYAYFMACEGKNLAKCAKMSRAALELEPENATFLDTYAWILHLQKKYSTARSYFKKAMLYGGNSSSTILEHYAATLEALGEDTLAKAYREQAKLKKDANK